MSFAGAEVHSGFEVVAGAVDLESRMRTADGVVTGEGSLDRQTLNGKTPAGVASIARQLGKPVFAIVGRAVQDRSVLDLFDGVLELRGDISETQERLRERAQELAKSFKPKPPAERPNHGFDS
jgi:glycerate kinase